MLKSLTLAATSLAFVAAPIAASAAPANPAASLSVAKAARAKSAALQSEASGADRTVPLVILAGIVAGAAYLIVDNEDEDEVADSN